MCGVGRPMAFAALDRVFPSRGPSIYRDMSSSLLSSPLGGTPTPAPGIERSHPCGFCARHLNVNGIARRHAQKIGKSSGRGARRRGHGRTWQAAASALAEGSIRPQKSKRAPARARRYFHARGAPALPRREAGHIAVASPPRLGSVTNAFFHERRRGHPFPRVQLSRDTVLALCVQADNANVRPSGPRRRRGEPGRRGGPRAAAGSGLFAPGPPHAAPNVPGSTTPGPRPAYTNRCPRAAAPGSIKLSYRHAARAAARPPARALTG